jgi:hypothetical protein
MSGAVSTADSAVFAQAPAASARASEIEYFPIGIVLPEPQGNYSSSPLQKVVVATILVLEGATRKDARRVDDAAFD